MNSAISSIMSSRVFPLLEDSRGWIERTFSNRTKVSFWALVMSALSWRPKASGWGFRGRFSMYFRYDCWSSAGGE